MKLKRAILEQLSRDALKLITDELELDGVDRRSVTALRQALSRARRATPQLLLEPLGHRLRHPAPCPAVDRAQRRRGGHRGHLRAGHDLLMGDLLKNMRSSQIFSVCGQPDVALRRTQDDRWQVELRGLDVFDPVTMDVDPRRGDDVPCWLLDTDYNDLCFHVCQAFFHRTSAWDNLRRALKGQYADSVWDHLAGAVSAPFDAGDHGRIAVKVIDDRGNELMVVRELREGPTR
jgi:hypothetical protein